MEPKIVQMKKLCIVGLTGDGSDTGKVWGNFQGFYDKNHFQKLTKMAMKFVFLRGYTACAI